MSAIQTERFPYKLMNKYPGMRPKDEIIWDSFVMRYPDMFDYCWYNVPVGDPSREDFSREEMQRNGAWGVSTWRIDVLAQKGDKYFVIELKPEADTHAIGEVVAYRGLLMSEGKITSNSLPMVITDSASVILKQACAAIGVECWEA